VAVAVAVGVAVVVDGGKGSDGCGPGCGGGDSGEGGGQGGREGVGSGGVVIFDQLLRSLHFVQTSIILTILLISQLHPLKQCVSFFIYLLPLLEASQPHPLQ
jgi:hypothetical protein